MIFLLWETGNKGLELEVITSPFSNSFGMKGLFEDAQLKISFPEISKDNARAEDKETVGNSLVEEEHEEQIAFLTDSPVTAHHSKCFLHGGELATLSFLYWIRYQLSLCY